MASTLPRPSKRLEAKTTHPSPILLLGLSPARLQKVHELCGVSLAVKHCALRNPRHLTPLPIFQFFWHLAAVGTKSVSFKPLISNVSEKHSPCLITSNTRL